MLRRDVGIEPATAHSALRAPATSQKTLEDQTLPGSSCVWSRQKIPVVVDLAIAWHSAMETMLGDLLCPANHVCGSPILQDVALVD